MRKLKKWGLVIWEGFKKNNIPKLAIAFFVIGVCFLKNRILGDWFDVTIFTSLICVILLETLAYVGDYIIHNIREDAIKLERDYDKLVSKYQTPMFLYDNKDASYENKRKLRKCYKKRFRDNGSDYVFKIPVTDVEYLKGLTVKIVDSTEQYELPKCVKEKYDEIMQAHRTSSVYNQLNIRVDDWKKEENQFCIYTSRTTYFKSLATNRAMDYKWKNGSSVREECSYGPIWLSLKASGLSNHWGYNGFVESSDGYIAFVKRDNDVSVGKGTYGTSVSASLKVKYVFELGQGHTVTKEGIINSVIKEMRDELKLNVCELEPLSFEKNILYVYRDIVEGGKPQFLAYAKSNLNHVAITENFKERKKKEKKKRFFGKLEDGKKLYWIKKEELKDLCITSEMMIYRGKKYSMTPSTAASLIMFKNYLENGAS